MYRSSIGGRDAARPHSGQVRAVYRHALVTLITPLLPSLAGGRGWSALTLAVGSALMSWDAAPTLRQRFESALAVLDAAIPRRRRVGRTYQGFIKALTLRSPSILGTLILHLRVLTQQAAGGTWRIGGIGGEPGFVPIGADGSRFDAPRTIANEQLGTAGKDKCGPQMMALLLVHLGTMLPWAWKVAGVRTSERTLLRGVLHQLPTRTLLVADAGFTGFDLLSDLNDRGHFFLIRVGRAVKLLTRLGSYRREGRSTVYLWPDLRHARAPLTLRLIRIGEVCLVTNITDPRRLSRKAAAELYRRRWGLEVAFRSLKQTLARRKVRSCTATHAQLELDWSVAGLWMLALLGARAITGTGHAARRLSIALTLAAVRAARSPGFTIHRLRKRLRCALQDTYRRIGPKKAYRWPHKKRPTPPPGQPRIAIATPMQVQQARSLRPLQHAA